MAHYSTTVHSAWSVEEAFDYMADLRNFAEWDPGVSKSNLVVGAAPGQGAEYDVSVTGMTLRYVIKAFDRPHRVVAEARNALLRSYDVIEVTKTPSGCDVTYDATLELQGPLKLADPLLGLLFNRIGDKAAAGMTKALAGKKVR